MEADLIESLKGVGYDGMMLDSNKLSLALEKGAKSVDFTELVAWLSDQINKLANLDEKVNPTTSPEDSSTFQLELSSFLKELGCVNTQLISGNVNQRLASKQERFMLLEYLISELMTCKMIQAKSPAAKSKLELTIHESDTARTLREMLSALDIAKPPDNITAGQLFNKVMEKLKKIVASAPADLLGYPLIIGELSPAQWEQLDQVQNSMKEEYKIRRQMMLQRLDVTVQSFLWSDRLKSKEDQLNARYHSKRDLMSVEPNVSIAQLLAARNDLAIIEKTSNATVRKNTQSSVTKVIIGEVPDRGGRANEQAPPPPEMPSWQKERAQDSQRGGGRGGRGGGGGRGRGGGGPGGQDSHKDVTTNFGQNRNNWQDNSQSGGSYNQHDNRGGNNYQQGGYDNRGGNYQQAGYDNRGGNHQQSGYDNRGGNYQQSGHDNRGGNYQQSGYDNRGGNYQQAGYDNRGGNYQQGYDNRGGNNQNDNRGGNYQQGAYNRGGGHHRGGGRVQGGWNQGGGGGYNRGGNRSQHY